MDMNSAGEGFSRNSSSVCELSKLNNTWVNNKSCCLHCWVHSLSFNDNTLQSFVRNSRVVATGVTSHVVCSSDETVTHDVDFRGYVRPRFWFVFPTLSVNMMSESVPVILYYQEVSNWLEWGQCVERGKIRKMEKGKDWRGEWSMGVVRGIIECLRGPHRHWAAGQGEENGVEERNKRLSQWGKQRERNSRGVWWENWQIPSGWIADCTPGLQKDWSDDTPFD